MNIVVRTRDATKFAGAVSLALLLTVTSVQAVDSRTPRGKLVSREPRAKGSAIFLHPDGMGAGTWHALRLKQTGPDGRLNWDRLPATAVYVGPMSDHVTATSNGGATSHNWGVRAQGDSFGMIGGKRVSAASGADVPIGLEARRRGRLLGLVNSASLTEAGTGVAVASVADRRDEAAIAVQMLASGAEVMLGGGEGWFLPQGVKGRHGPGLRKDGRNLVEEARRAGYAIVFTASELASASVDGKLLGLFAQTDTFNDGDRDALKRAGGLLKDEAPDWDIMIASALKRLTRDRAGYLLIANHEATDELGGENASGVLTAAAAADRAIGLALAAAEHDPGLTVVVASDSDSGALVSTDAYIRGPTIPVNTPGVRIEGDEEGRPLLAAPDKTGRRLPFTVAWGAPGDVAGGLVARGIGRGASVITGTIDSTDIYRALHLGLFGAPK